MSILQKFHDTWGSPDYPPIKVIKNELSELEEDLGVAFPLSYRLQVLEFGLPRPSARLWDWIEDNVSLADVLLGVHRPHFSEFLTPKGVQETLVWRKAGMPSFLLPFLIDSSGNSIAFDMRELERAPVPDAGVYFWDHDFVTTERLARSFDMFLGDYLP